MFYFFLFCGVFSTDFNYFYEEKRKFLINLRPAINSLLSFCFVFTPTTTTTKSQEPVAQEYSDIYGLLRGISAMRQTESSEKNCKINAEETKVL